ncbi:MAG: bifunctional 23S rRNA (guanine(2069)-N(7))-methyltransferase RlmK/23S rRNA (guanine(2445)-N(2))-methyltransferase RlmL [Gammaproteobacteria bacterium]|nr:bifunctional 23S rRNA (guanine(2069)-N(7))-methyltransferase RlmK/23S rRNA (guanine(2445)-N(2))-methyltransferase RlmL [Gammaproteobacteria bacterium]
MTSPILSFFATTAKGMEPLLTDELRGLGISAIAETRAGVSFEATLAQAYRVCLWSRIASRVLLPLARFEAPTPEALYDGVRAIRWNEHLAQDGTLAVDFSAVQSRITHTHFGALKVKDAIVDQFRERYGVRPSVARERPDVRVNVHLRRDEATVSIDLAGESLHRRGYRQEGVEAPLKESLAAAILLRAGWPAIARDGGALFDPMCGSGTLPIEAALIAADIAPGLLRPYYGFLRWKGHDAAAWAALLAEAGERREQGLRHLPPIVGYDGDAKAARVAAANVQRAGLQGLVRIEQRELAAVDGAPAHGRGGTPGLVIVNPPYGERLGQIEELRPLYRLLGDKLKEYFHGWKAAVFTGNPDLGKHIGLRARRIHTLYNGAIECKLLSFDVVPEWYVGFHARGGEAVSTPAPTPVSVLAPAAPPSAGAQMFANRLRKNLKTLGRWAEREGVHCYRLYDADLPEYALAVDIYEQWVHVQEYQAPRTIDPAKAEARLREALAVIPEALGVPAGHVFFKVRQRQKGKAQYEKLDATGEFHEVREGNCKLLVNFSDYLDTGLFLDHRPTRLLIQQLARGKRFLNLFGYTGAATVHAAMGGAAATTTVDMSNTYLDWAKRNLALNGFGGRNHPFIQADCLAWMEQEQGRYDLIFLDPPTFSTSKRMADTLDIQRDHVALIKAAVRLLASGGVLIFSNNFQRFKMDREALAGLTIEDITRATLPKDFERNPRIHNCWRITRKR